MKKIISFSKNTQLYYVLLLLVFLGFVLLMLIIARRSSYKEHFNTSTSTSGVQWYLVYIYHSQPNEALSAKFSPIFVTAKNDWYDANTELSNMFIEKSFALSDTIKEYYGIRQGPALVIVNRNPDSDKTYPATDIVKNNGASLSYMLSSDDANKLLTENLDTTVLAATVSKIQGEIKNFMNTARELYKTNAGTFASQMQTSITTNQRADFTYSPGVINPVHVVGSYDSDVVWRRAHGGAHYWTGPVGNANNGTKPLWICDSPVDNQASNRKYEYVYNNSSSNIIDCTFYLNADNAGVLYLNGKSACVSGAWNSTSTGTGKLLPGNNLITVTCQNWGGPGGILCACSRSNNKDDVLFVTNRFWKRD